MAEKTYLVIVKPTGTYREVITTNSIQIIDGVLHTDDQSFEITDRTCVEVE